jgi:tetratricopeptide (TPR) repeat protein
MKILSIALLLVLVLLSAAALLLMLGGVISRVLREKSRRKGPPGSGRRGRGRIVPSRMAAEYYGGLDKARDAEIRNLFEKALSLKHTRRFRKAVDLLTQGLKEDLTSEQEIGTLVTIGNCHLGANNYLQAREHYQKANRQAGRSADEKGKLSSLVNLGLVSAAEKKWDEAIGFYQEAIALDRKLGYAKGEAIDLNTLGLLCENRGDLDGALTHYSASIEIFRKLKDVEKTELVENNIERVKNLAQ